MSLTPNDIQILLDALEDSDWDTATISVGDVSISVSRNGAAPVVASAPAPVAPAAVSASAPAAPAATEAAAQPAQPARPASATPSPVDPSAGHIVTAPTIGVYWAAPQPGAAPFVEIGTKVKKGDTLCIVEVMKLMNNITSDVDGEVIGIHCQNAQAVEFGAPMFTISRSA